MHIRIAPLIVSLVCVTGAFAQTAPPAETPEQTPAPDGLWLSDRTIELIIARWADEISDDYELEPLQQDRIRTKMASRWTTYLHENRATLQPLVNEFIEMRLQMEKPSSEQVSEWSNRALQAFDGIQEEMNGGIEDFREELNPLQQARFEKEVLQFGVGLRFFRSKLEQWKSGEYEEYELWEPTQAERRRRREARMEAAGETPPEPEQVDQVAAEVDRWREYVEEVIRVYNLDEGQRDAALSCLKELQTRAMDYRDRRRKDIAHLERRIAKHEGDQQELEEITAQLTELYGPIDDMFQELKSRVEALPTTQQRQRVGKDLEEQRERAREARREARRQRELEAEKAPESAEE